MGRSLECTSTNLLLQSMFRRFWLHDPNAFVLGELVCAALWVFLHTTLMQFCIVNPGVRKT